jgi:ABC-type glycerol-3-phosphate transport system substrate-binding protein
MGEFCRKRMSRAGSRFVGLVLGVVISQLVSAQEGALSVRGFSLPDEIASVRVEQFEEQFPDVQLDLQEGSLDQQQLLTAVASGNPPDVIYLSRDALSTFATRGAITPLTECIESQGIDMTQYREAAVSQVTVNGEVYGIPEFFNTIIVMLGGFGSSQRTTYQARERQPDAHWL